MQGLALAPTIYAFKPTPRKLDKLNLKLALYATLYIYIKDTINTKARVFVKNFCLLPDSGGLGSFKFLATYRCC